MTSAIAAYGIALKIGDGGATEAFTEIAEVTSITPPAIVSETADVSAHDGAGWREFIPTVLALDEFTCEINYDPAGSTHTGMITDMVAGTLRNFQLVYTDTGATTWLFAAYITRFAPQGMTVDGAITAQITFRPSQDAAPTLQ